MFKKIFYGLIATLIFFNVGWSSADVGLVTTSDNLRFPIFALDDTGKVSVPDSIHLMVWFEGEATGDTASYVERIATAGATPDLIDSLVVGGVDYYYFDHSIGDIDNNEGEGNYTGTAVLWTDGQPTFNNFSFILYDTESELVYDSVGLGASIADEALDTLKLQDDWVAQNSSFDTLKYGGGVWVDAGANTNTVVGTDGIPTNPVGTIAAAKTIADAIGLKTIYFVEGTNETIAATMEHYEFIGIGAMMDVTITLGDQDVDGSKFENVYISGIQGGTGFMLANSCVLDGADSLEVHAVDCAIQGPLSVRGGDSYFNNCYSTVAGDGTPNLDFDGDAATIAVSMRHYSGGLQLLGMTSNHTISYESDGQLIINADCVSGNVTARGNMTITDNGTTMSITKDAVFSRSEADLWVWSNIDTTVNVDTALMVELLTDRVWNALLTGATYNVATSAGRRLRQIDAAFTLATGQAQVSGTPTDPGTYIILAAATSEADDFFNHATITIDGGTGVGQSRSIDDYTGATDSAALHGGDDWITDPDATSTYVISPGNPVEVVNFHGDNALDQMWEYDTAGISGAQAIGTILKDTSAYQAEISVPSDTNINGDTAAVIGNDQAMRLQSLVVSNSSGDAVQFTSTGGNGDGLQVTADGAGYGFAAIGDPSGGTGYGIGAIGGQTSGEGLYVYSYSGDAAEFIANAGNGNGIKLIAQGSGVEITHDDLVDAVYEEDTASHQTAGTMGILFDAKISDAGGVASISDADMKAIGDTVWNRDSTEVDTGRVGTWMKNNIGGGTLDSTAVYGAVEQLAADSGIVTYSHGADSVLLLKRFAITGANGANPSFYIQNTDGDAVHFRGVTGHGLRLQGVSDGSALYATASSGATAVQFTSTGVDGSSEPGEDFRIDSAVMTIITGTLDTVNYVKAGGFGRGLRTLTITATDTMGTDTNLGGINIDARFPSGQPYMSGLNTNSSGVITISAQEFDTLVFWVYPPQMYVFPEGAGDTSMIMPAGDSSITLVAYNRTVDAPGQDSVCRVYAYGDVKGCQLTAILRKDNVEDTCVNKIIVKRLLYGKVADTSGYSFIDLPWGSCMFHPSVDTVKWNIKMMYNNMEQWKKDKFVVPDSATHRITREN